MKIGVYVGSFNPPHKGHIKIVNHLINNKYVDKILIIPTNNYWNKTNLIDLNHRLNMLKTFENNNIIINNTLNNLEYTYQIINELKKDNNEYSLIIGSDKIVDFNKWKNYEELLKLEILIINRNNIDTKYYLDKLNKKDKYKIINIKNIIDEQVLDYIKKENLYSKINIYDKIYL